MPCYKVIKQYRDKCFIPRAVFIQRRERRPRVKKQKEVAAGAGHPSMTSETRRISLIFLLCPGETTYSHFMTTVPE